jgi:PmbA protein
MQPEPDYHKEIDNLLKQASKLCDHAQVICIDASQDLISMENNALKSLSSGNTQKVILKVWLGKRQGTAHTSTFTPDILKTAINVAKSSKDKEYFYGLPKKQDYPQIKPDKKILNLSEEDLLQYADNIIKDSHDREVSLSNAYLEKHFEKRIIANTNGLMAESSIANFSASVSCVSHDKNASYADSFTEPFFVPYIDFGAMVKDKVRQFMKAQDPKKIAIPKNIPIILKTEPFSQLLQYALLENLNGYNYEKQKSCFLGKLNTKILSPISIMDDGTFPKGINTDGFDFEGEKRKNTVLFDKGVLKNLVYDYNTAKNNKTNSTGNAGMSGIEFSNIVIDGPKGNVDKALLIDGIMGAHTANHLTTDFSVRAEYAYYYDHGKLTPLKSFMVSGNLVEALSNVLFVGKHRYHKSGVYSGDICCEKISAVF